MKLTRSENLILTCLLLVFTSPTLAYNFEMTKLEFLTMSPMCQFAYGKSTSGVRYGFNRMAPEISSRTKDMIRGIGLWHYCGGAIRIRRGEYESDARERKVYFERGIEDCLYTYRYLNSSHPLSAEIATTIGRGYKGLGEIDRAKKFFEEALASRPNYVKGLLEYGLLYYDGNDYEQAKKLFARAWEVSSEGSSQAAYFIGLAELKLNNVEQAQVYADKAKQLGYPLEGLQNLINENSNN